MNEQDFFESVAKITRIPIRLAAENETCYGEQFLVRTRDEEGARNRLVGKLKPGDTEWEDYIPDVPVRLYAFAQKDERRVVILGPVAYGSLTGPEARIYLHKNHIERLPECTFSRMKDIIRLIRSADADDGHGTVSRGHSPEKHAEHPGPSDALSSHLTETEIDQYEGFKENHSYIDESPIKNAIIEGNVELVRGQFENLFPAYPVVLKDIYKNEEYMAVSSISLFARHAMEGGVPSREALLLNDVCLQKLSECKTIQELHAVMKEAAIHFAESVQREKKRSSLNLRVAMCKKIIIDNRLKPIRVDDIADQIGISKEYLLKLFRKEEGITVREYITRTKMEAAANMLKYSDRHVGEISDYLAFDSVSYFSRTFTKIYGMPPKEYRKKYSRLF